MFNCTSLFIVIIWRQSVDWRHLLTDCCNLKCAIYLAISSFFFLNAFCIFFVITCFYWWKALFCLVCWKLTTDVTVVLSWYSFIRLCKFVLVVILHHGISSSVRSSDVPLMIKSARGNWVCKCWPTDCNGWEFILCFCAFNANDWLWKFEIGGASHWLLKFYSRCWHRSLWGPWSICRQRVLIFVCCFFCVKIVCLHFLCRRAIFGYFYEAFHEHYADIRNYVTWPLCSSLVGEVRVSPSCFVLNSTNFENIHSGHVSVPLEVVEFLSWKGK